MTVQINQWFVRNLDLYVLTRCVKGSTWFSYFVINILSLTAQLGTNLMSLRLKMFIISTQLDIFL